MHAAYCFNARGLYLNRSGVHDTLQAKSGGGRSINYTAPVFVADRLRHLTEVEAERLNGFPDRHTERHASTLRNNWLGDTVAVPLFRWLGWRVSA